MPAKKTWKEKLNIDRKPEVEIVSRLFAGTRFGDKLLIPTPKMIVE